MVAKDHPQRIVLKEDRIKYWLSHGALPTDRVARFLGATDLIKKPVYAEQTKKHLPKAKTLERIKEKEEAEKAAKENTSAPEEEAKVEEAPAEEAKAEGEKKSD